MVRATFLMFLTASVAFTVVRSCATMGQSVSETPDVQEEVCKLGTSC